MMTRRSRLIRNATIAALVGSTIGAAAGVWSVRKGGTTIAVSPMSPGESVVASSSSPTTAVANGPSRRDGTARDDGSSAIAVATRGIVQPAAPAAAVRSGSAEDEHQKIVQRARTLAAVPDVAALVALRESTSRRADERGEQESPSAQALIREIDKYLADARRLRLKLDGDDLRREQAANPPRTGR